MKLGISGWNQAVENVAEKYDVETLNDFAMDISTSYKKGIPVVHSVARKTKEIRQTHLLTVKERASKATNTILMPIIFFSIHANDWLYCISVGDGSYYWIQLKERQNAIIFNSCNCSYMGLFLSENTKLAYLPWIDNRMVIFYVFDS